MRYRWFASDKKDELGMPVARLPEELEPPQEEKEGLDKGVLMAFGMAAVVFGYALWSSDLQLLLFGAAVMIYLIHPLPAKMWGRQGRTLGNLFKGFGMAMGVGALVWAFL